MKLNEIVDKAGLSKRAIKYYEESGLLVVKKDENGYRNYDENNLEALKKISFYRQLGISIKDIKKLLEEDDPQLLEAIHQEKVKDVLVLEKELQALETYIQNRDIDQALQSVDYENVAMKIQEMIPGFYGYYFMQHFLPFLQISITSKQQEEALQNIIDFLDNVEIKIPLFIKLNSYVMYRFTSKKSMVIQMEKTISNMLNLSEEDYQKLKQRTYSNVKLKNTFFYKYNPAFISQRRLMKRLQDCGYNDIFIPNMIALSPKYKEYHDALMKVNHRLCNDLGLHYDSNYQLVMKKEKVRK